MAYFFAKKIKTFNADKKGVTMLEYGLIAALIAVACITAVTALGTNIAAEFGTVNTALTK
ncbi:MAG: Flp family type IVb pilin [Rhodomicrobium sp.]